MAEAATAQRNPLKQMLRRQRLAYRRAARRLADRMPKGLYARSLLIVILPILIIQSVAAYVFMERHWQAVTGRLSEATARSIAAELDLIEKLPPEGQAIATEAFRTRQGLSLSFLATPDLPPLLPRPFFTLFDDALMTQIASQVRRPFWADTIGASNMLDIRVRLADDRVVQILANRSQSYASNSVIFLGWLFGTSAVLIVIAILFLRNQIRPIQQLAGAAEAFGKGQPVGEFAPHGAREVRQASQAFIDMRRRIERQIEQRTTMLAGVSHDMRTILTRFRLQLALIGRSAETEALEGEVNELQSMLEGYLAFARGDGDEAAEPTDVAALIRSLADSAERAGSPISAEFEGPPIVTLRPNAMRRALDNLIGNAMRHADTVTLTARHDAGRLVISVDDDGPGVPPEEREAVFKPFYRLDAARNQDVGGTGLGLAICRDIVRGHGGDVTLADSPLGGLRAIINIPG